MKLIRHSTVCFAFLLLASCARPDGPAPAEVLQRAARASREIPSAHFTASVAVDGLSSADTPLHAVFDVEGRMQNGGGQMTFTLEGSGTSGPDSAWQGKADIVIAAENDVYVRVRELTLPSSASLPPAIVNGLVNQWWHLPPAGAPPAMPGMTPDPQILTMQAEIVDVVRDRGLVTVHGRTTYHYDVKLNPEKLGRFLEEVARQRGEPADAAQMKAFTEDIDATGELWIDADTFAVQGLQWTITSGGQSQPMTVIAGLDITDFGPGEPIEPPKGAGILPLNPADFLPSGSFFDAAVPSLP